MKHSEKAIRNRVQNTINEIVSENMHKMLNEFRWQEPCKRLRSCTAWVYQTENYYVLRSYNTVIACIDKNTNVLYDFLRLVYGYTSTSAQHISKFRHDYPAIESRTFYHI